MHRLHCVLLATVAGVGLASNAFAADLPTKAPVYKAPVAAPVLSWTGFYVGLNAGYAWGNSDPALIIFPHGEPFFSPGSGSTSGPPPGLNPRGFIGGGQAGYNWQLGQWLVGGEIDFSGLDAKADASLSPFFVGKGPNTTTWSTRYDWLFTARLRGGFLVAPNWLAYVTGGLAVTHVKDSAVCMSSSSGCLDSTTPQTVTWAESKTLTGGTIGGGVETMFAPNWTARVEYLYAKFQDTTPVVATANGTLVPVPSLFSFHHDLNIVRFAINYKFNP